MEPSSPEVLVIVQPGVAIEDAIPAVARILQQLPPRLVIVTADEDTVRAIKRSAKVAAAFTREVPTEALDKLDQTTRAFATAWNERRRSKERPGDELPWDTPGFQAP